MNVRRAATALACAPLCVMLAAESAQAQDRIIFGPADPARSRITPNGSAEPRIPVIPEQPRRAALTSIESWSVGEDAEVSLGRFRVVDQVRRRTGAERERQPLQMEAETKALAGAGFRLRF